jgi:hypothetical protein
MDRTTLKPVYDPTGDVWRIKKQEGKKWVPFGSNDYFFQNFISVMEEINRLNNQLPKQLKPIKMKTKYYHFINSLSGGRFCESFCRTGKNPVKIALYRGGNEPEYYNVETFPDGCQAWGTPIPKEVFDLHKAAVMAMLAEMPKP